MNYETVAKRIPTLIQDLSKVQTQYSYGQQYLGEAVSMLALLKDILENAKE